MTIAECILENTSILLIERFRDKEDSLNIEEIKEELIKNLDYRQLNSYKIM